MHYSVKLRNAKRCCISHVFKELLKQIEDPVDFELPDSFNKLKPYMFIKRNIHLSKMKRPLEDDGIFCSCNSTGSLAVCDKDCHCGMLLSSCSSACKCGSTCLNKPFHCRPMKKMKLVKTEKCGAGIVADEDIMQGDFIVEYVGEVIDDETCERRLWKMKDRGETNFYLCEINRDTIIDATYKGNKSRYINHSCCPNTEMQKWRTDGETRIGIFASRDISRGEHLTYDYQFVQFGADQDCYCGAVSCRKKLGVKPGKPKVPSSEAALRIVAYHQVYQNGGMHRGSTKQQGPCSRNCIDKLIMIFRPTNHRDLGVIKRYDDQTNKHSVMFEDGSIDLFDLSNENWELIF